MDLVFVGSRIVFFGVQQAKKFKVLRCIVNTFVVLLIKKCVVRSILVEANLSLAMKLQPDFIIRTILQVAFNEGALARDRQFCLGHWQWTRRG